MYQRCPFCDRLFEIGESDYRPMKHHIRAAHDRSPEGGATDEASATAPSL